MWAVLTALLLVGCLVSLRLARGAGARLKNRRPAPAGRVIYWLPTSPGGSATPQGRGA